jgi:hypothetical protein
MIEKDWIPAPAPDPIRSPPEWREKEFSGFFPIIKDENEFLFLGIGLGMVVPAEEVIGPG